MLRLIGLVVVVLFVLSLAHGERSGGAYDRMNARADGLVDQLTGTLAGGVHSLGDLVFGPSEPGFDRPDMRTLGHNLDALSRSADGASKRALAAMVLRSCPSLGLVCQPAATGPKEEADGEARRRPFTDEPR